MRHMSCDIFRKVQNLAETSRSHANRKSLTAEKSLSTWRSCTRWKANAIPLFIEGDNKRMSISLFNARDNFALDKIGTKSSQDRAADVIEEEGKMIPRYRWHKTFKVQICMLQPVPHLSWSCLLDVESRGRPRYSDCQIRKLRLYPCYFECKILSLARSFSPSRLSFAHTCNFTPSEAKDFTPANPAISRKFLEQSLLPFVRTAFGHFEDFALKPSCLWARFSRYWYRATSPR